MVAHPGALRGSSELISRNDLMIYDRGSTGFWFYTYHIQHNLSFCVRAKTNQDIIVKEFIASNKKQTLVALVPAKKCFVLLSEKIQR